jgi:hypothetical protein
MDFELIVIPKTGYIHAVVTGRNTPENVRGYLDELLLEIRTRNCPYVLLEERLEGDRLGLTEVFQIVSEGTEKALGTVKAIAYVDRNAEDDTMEFAELVATNRSLPARVFSSVKEAERWLQGVVAEADVAK